jgi:hypothetical protein
MITNILTAVSLLVAIPLGLLLRKLTKDEKEIFSKAPYFPVLLWVFAIVASVMYTINTQIAIPLTFIFLTVLIWNRT